MRKATDGSQLDRIKEQKPKLLVKEVEIDRVAELGTGLELIAADGSRRIGGIGHDLLEWLPIGRQASVANTLKVVGGLGLIGNAQTALYEKRELVSKTEMGLGVGRKHRP